MQYFIHFAIQLLVPEADYAITLRGKISCSGGIYFECARRRLVTLRRRSGLWLTGYASLRLVPLFLLFLLFLLCVLTAVESDN